MLLQDARIGDICFDESDRSLWGLRHSQRLRDPGAHPVPVHQLGPGPHLALRGRALRTRRVGRRLDALDVHREARRLAVPARVPPRGPRGRQRDADGPVRFRPGHPRGLRIHARWPVPVRQLLLHRRFQHLPLRARDRRTRGRQQCGDGLLPPDPDGGRYADRPGIHGRRLRADDHRSEAAGRRQRHHLPRRADREQAPDRPRVGRRLARGRGPRVHDHAPRQVPADARARLWRRLSHRRGLSRFHRARLARSPRRPRPVPPARYVRELLAGRRTCPRKRSRTSTCATRRRSGAGSTGTTARISTTCSARPSEAARATRSSANTTRR